MNNPRLATRYAKSLVDLGTEQNELGAIYTDMKLLQAMFKSNPDLVQVLVSPVIKADKKEKIIAAVLDGRISKVSSLFINLLIRKGREENLPEISNAVITQYNTINNIHKVKITTAVPMSDELRNSIEAKVKSSANLENIEMESTVDEDLIGGFVLEVGGNLVDASVLRDLKDIKKQFLNNDYVHKLR